VTGRLEGKVAIVTGAAEGQGAGVARRFASEGARVALFDVQEDVGKQTAETIAADGGEVFFQRCDVSLEADVAAAVEATVERYSGLDVLYNNAAVIRYGRKIAELPVDEWDHTLGVNLRGPFLCAKHALPHLVARGGGSIVNLTSHGAFQASPTGIADYGASKGAIVTLTYYLASEYGPENVRANCISPGPVPTALNERFLGNEAALRATEQMIPLRRVGAIEDIASAALFLASDESRWISGAVLRVDGGIVVQ
jgi:NAD(P)-dependent dehydrogenase (short-subunit alcohol dehydrogenase family)